MLNIAWTKYASIVGFLSSICPSRSRLGNAGRVPKHLAINEFMSPESRRVISMLQLTRLLDATLIGVESGDITALLVRRAVSHASSTQGPSMRMMLTLSSSACLINRRLN